MTHFWTTQLLKKVCFLFNSVFASVGDLIFHEFLGRVKADCDEVKETEPKNIFEAFASSGENSASHSVNNSPVKTIFLDKKKTDGATLSTQISSSRESTEDEEDGDHKLYNPSLPLDFSFNLSQAHVMPKCAVCSLFRVGPGVLLH